MLVDHYEHYCVIISSLVDCNFDNELCVWQNLLDDEFDWSRKKGKTMSSNTGPSYDHTTNSGINYIYSLSKYI